MESPPMAKRKSSSTKKRPSNDALNLAAINWYAMSINRLATQIYVTDPKQFESLNRTLAQALESLKHAQAALVTPCGDCPDGWECCRNGLCAPTCDDVADA